MTFTPCTVIIILFPVWNFMVCYKVNLTFSGVFAKLRKATIIFVMSVCPSLRPSVRTKQHIFYVQKNFFSKIVSFMTLCGNILQSCTGHRWQYGACPSHAGTKETYKHSEYGIIIAFFFYCNNSRTNQAQYYVLCTLPILFTFIIDWKLISSTKNLPELVSKLPTNSMLENI